MQPLSPCDHQLHRLRDSGECTDSVHRRNQSPLNDDSMFDEWLVALWEQK